MPKIDYLGAIRLSDQPWGTQIIHTFPGAVGGLPEVPFFVWRTTNFQCKYVQSIDISNSNQPGLVCVFFGFLCWPACYLMGDNDSSDSDNKGNNSKSDAIVMIVI